ncbi:zinc-ribbon domain-containing protein [Oceaniglobus trochenteri]|uniref:zinc-ribbon domain-containing protein n=1 Tax=Oceaniglobus trochenteri TaxID=2763260 RepID=UPI001CFF64E2|nr:zinc-ribbon domain-containing protein [Oceaniglobus trochenteri]
MRLICPNCAAEYEVDASMIPDEGRDVQCSSCGHTWFQRPDTAEDDLAEEMGVTLPDPAFEEPEPDEPRAPAAAPAPKARQMDEATRDILREEARREAEARRRERGGRGGLESQPDLGLTDPEGAQSRAAAAKARLARLRDTPEEATEQEAEEAAVDAAAPGSSRRELLPDIEEINSTLTATGDRHGPETVEEEEQAAESRRGFRFGFFTVFLTMAVLMAIYLFAPQIAAAVPALSPALTGYVGWADGVLDVIRAGLQQAVGVMQGLIGTDG